MSNFHIISFVSEKLMWAKESALSTFNFSKKMSFPKLNVNSPFVNQFSSLF